MKHIITTLLLFLTIALTVSLSSCGKSEHIGQALSELEELAQTYGGKIATYRPSDGGNVPEAIVSLYGKAGVAPDELEFLEYAVVWYSDRYISADAAVFLLKNATDAPSFVKMCHRRANTLALTLKAKPSISQDGHFIRFYNLPPAG